MRARPLLLALLAATSLLVPHGVAALPNSPVKTKVTIPFGGVLYHPGTGENVTLAGAVAVKTVVKYLPQNPVIPNNPIYPPVPVKVTTAYKVAKGTTAIGATTGSTYTLKGAGKTDYFFPNDPIYPNNPIRNVTDYAVLHMFPGTPITPNNPIKAFRVLYQVNFDDNGVMTTTAAVLTPDPSGACAPVTTVCSTEQPLVTPCTDGLKDQDETDVDCGGATCAARCPQGATCAADGDCLNGICVAGLCG